MKNCRRRWRAWCHNQYPGDDDGQPQSPAAVGDHDGHQQLSAEHHCSDGTDCQLVLLSGDKQQGAGGNLQSISENKRVKNIENDII